MVNLIISRDLTDRLFVNFLSASDPISRFFLDSIYGQNRMADYIAFRSGPRVMDVFWHMVEEYLTQKDYFRQILNADLVRLFAELLRVNPPSVFEVRGDSDRSVAMLGYLEQHCADCTLQQLADAFHFSASHTSAMLRKYCGTSFSQLQTRFRLSHACNYLKNSSLSAETICEIIGYGDVSYFYKQFKKTYGVNPSDYRKGG